MAPKELKLDLYVAGSPFRSIMEKAGLVSTLEGTNNMKTIGRVYVITGSLSVVSPTVEARRPRRRRRAEKKVDADKARLSAAKKISKFDPFLGALVDNYHNETCIAKVRLCVVGASVQDACERVHSHLKKATKGRVVAEIESVNVNGDLQVW